MTPQEFISKWKSVELKERSASQSHFNDLCRLLGIDEPTTADPKGEWFTFEKGASKTSGGEGWADVWRKDCFAWEYKGKRKNLDAAFDQLLRYSVALDHPPLLIVSDMDQILIHTNWTNTVQKVYALTLDDLLEGGKRDLLKNAFVDPERLKPAKTRQVLTEDAAKKFSTIAQRLRDRKHDAHTVAHFVNRLVFCLFAEDVGLLPNKMFERLLGHCHANPGDFEAHAKTLFAAMKSGGMVGFERIDWFNGGLFDDDTALPLEKGDIAELQAAAAMDWSDIDPSILGTLFERGLDPAKRSQLGAHYTDRDKIMQIVDPVIVRPLLAEWAEVKAKIEDLLDKAPKETSEKLLRGKELAARTRALNAAEALQARFLERLRAFRVLDPACGSGNFLYLSLLSLKDLEHRINLETEALGLPSAFPTIGPECVKGIELNPYAAELARVSVWIGEIQWMRRNGYEASKNPILRSLGTIECRDAALNSDGTVADWPNVDVVVGNPPFLGNKKMNRELGDAYTQSLRKAFSDVPGGVDLVAYWFATAWAKIKAGELTRAGLVSTNSIRSGANREVLKPIVAEGRIFAAWPDEPWFDEKGAAVRVSMTCFDASEGLASLDGTSVLKIHADLRSGDTNLTVLSRLSENKNASFVGVILNGDGFELDGCTARNFLQAPTNPNNRNNSDVLRPTLNGDDFNGTRPDKWVIDFGTDLSEEDASLFETPFEHINLSVKPYRQRVDENGDYEVKAKNEREIWWRHARSRPQMRKALHGLSRYVATPMVTSYRNFGFLPSAVLPDQKLVVFPKDDFTFLGVLESKFHLVWTFATCSWIGSGNDVTYAKLAVFETFPFPEGMTPNISASDYSNDPRAQAIAATASRLDEQRENWLHPVNLIERVPEVIPGYPDRVLPKNEAAVEELKKRTLTNLYNARPTWLDHAHRALDKAVAEAYGWGDDWLAGTLTDDEILARLFKLNQERSQAKK